MAVRGTRPCGQAEPTGLARAVDERRSARPSSLPEQDMLDSVIWEGSLSSRICPNKSSNEFDCRRMYSEKVPLSPSIIEAITSMTNKGMLRSDFDILPGFATASDMKRGHCNTGAMILTPMQVCTSR